MNQPSAQVLTKLLQGHLDVKPHKHSLTKNQTNKLNMISYVKDEVSHSAMLCIIRKIVNHQIMKTKLRQNQEERLFENKKNLRFRSN